MSQNLMMPNIKTDRQIAMEEAGLNRAQQSNAMAQAEFDEYQAGAPGRNALLAAKQMEAEEYQAAARRRARAGEIEATGAQMGQDRDQMEWEYGQLAQVGDEASWDRYIANRERAEFDSEHLPDSFNPETVAMAMEHLQKGLGTAGSVTAREKLNQQIVEEQGRDKRFEGLRGSQDVGYLKEATAAKTKAKALATEEASKVVGLPKAEADATLMIDRLKELKAHEGKGMAVGRTSMFPVVPGTSTQDFHSKLDQIKGGQFMQAYQGLKGGGQITEVEGAKAEQAIANLDVAQSEEQFNSALDEFIGIVEKGLKRAQSGVAQAPAPLPPVNAQGWKIMTDASGNRAYVGPNGEIEEIM